MSKIRGLSHSIQLFVEIECSAAAEVSGCPFLALDLCSLARDRAVRLVSPMYVESQLQSLQKTPDFSIASNLSSIALVVGSF